MRPAKGPDSQIINMHRCLDFHSFCSLEVNTQASGPIWTCSHNSEAGRGAGAVLITLGRSFAPLGRIVCPLSRMLALGFCFCCCLCSCLRLARAVRTDDRPRSEAAVTTAGVSRSGSFLKITYLRTHSLVGLFAQVHIRNAQVDTQNANVLI